MLIQALKAKACALPTSTKHAEDIKTCMSDLKPEESRIMLTITDSPEQFINSNSLYVSPVIDGHSC